MSDDRGATRAAIPRKIRIDHPTSWPHHRSGWGPCALRLQAELGTAHGVLCIDSEDRLRNTHAAGAIREPFILISHYVPFGHPRHRGWNLTDFAVSPGWLACRDRCAGVITLSRYACEHARRLLGVPCDWVLHPTEAAALHFSLERFEASPEKRLVMLGWWMRRFATLAQIRAPGFTKLFLPGVRDHRPVVSAMAGEGCTETAWLRPRLGNTDYDELLSASVVLLDLFDASAVNSLIECATRRTPVLVRLLPAVMEYLGEGYPFYFTSLEEAEEKLRDRALIDHASRYLAEESVQERIALSGLAAKVAATAVYQSCGGRLPSRLALQGRFSPAACQLVAKSSPNVTARLIAYYFPQFHPIPENDRWWGKGFTDWRYVAAARPLFDGHYQPRIPADLGYYDLRVPETRQQQADMARDHGIEGFLYWHYWFHGRRILNRVFDEVLESRKPQFPFCLGWANENWEGRWHGLAHGRRLLTQEYSLEDSRSHFYALLPAFRDRRYITVAGKPLFHVKNCYYRPVLGLEYLDLWQELARKEGLPGIYFTTEVYFARDWQAAWGRRRLAHFDAWTYVNLTDFPEAMVVRRDPTVYGYADAAGRFLAPTDLDRYFPTVLPGWDNTPRWPSGYLFHEADPERFAEAVREALEAVAPKPAEERIVFLKSWNEWGEGNHLEPDLRFGHGFLRAISGCL